MIFIETVISEVDIRIAEIFLRWHLIVLSAETSQSLLVEVANVRIYGRNEDI